ncbi:thiamine phosphate synthase [Paenibacillus sp. DS2015]|uniref:thiamine phosphate synthase n=1 Tax=Paenibacillus sp. DS2015 TaxID=3373917 RepID=UPI003D201973
MSTRELHIISNGQNELERFVWIAERTHTYVTAFHLREKFSTAATLWHGVMALKAGGVPIHKVIINDRVDVAWAAQTGGVQLAYHSLQVQEVRRSFPGLRIGCSVHSVEEADDMSKYGADFLLYGHIFASNSKLNQEPRGIALLKEVVDRVQVPIIAIGGIQPEHVQQVIGTGATGIAILSGITSAPDPIQAVKDYRRELDAGGGKGR